MAVTVFLVFLPVLTPPKTCKHTHTHSHKRIFPNKLECKSRTRFSSLVYCVWARPGAYYRVEHLKSSSMGQTFALPTNIRLGWKGLPETKALAYHECSYITAVKSDLSNTFSIEKIYKFLKSPLTAATQYLHVQTPLDILFSCASFWLKVMALIFH